MQLKQKSFNGITRTRNDATEGETEKDFLFIFLLLYRHGNRQRKFEKGKTAA